MCWYTKYFEDQGQLQLYKRETKNRFQGLISDLDNYEAEAISRMLEKLSKNKPPKPSNPNAFLFTMFKNALIDFHRENYGRPRVPLKMKREGPVISKIFELHCLSKRSIDEISESLAVHKQIVRHWTSWLTNEKKCPKQLQMISADSGGEDGRGIVDSLSDVDNPNPTEQQTVDSEDSAILGLLKGVMQPGDSSEGDTVSGIEGAVIARLREQLQLSDEQVILLSMRYVEGMTKAAAAKELNLSRKAFEKQEVAVLSQMRQAFAMLGIEQ